MRCLDAPDLVSVSLLQEEDRARLPWPLPTPFALRTTFRGFS